MMVIRRSDERGHSDLGWLQSHFTFSFADYHDPQQMGFRSLRVINEDWIAAGKGFGPHAHRDMEILTYVLEGQVLHRDSMGEEHVLSANQIQLMSAGTGVVHSEFNASGTHPTHLMQIWMVPQTEDLQPYYQQMSFDPADKQGRLLLLAASAAHYDGAVPVIQQDVRVYVVELASDQKVPYTISESRHAWIQVVKGDIDLNGSTLNHGDGAAISDERDLLLQGAGARGGEALVFDLA